MASTAAKAAPMAARYGQTFPKIALSIIEIDKSARGATRKQDLGLLFSAIGKPLDHRPDWLGEGKAYLRHAVIHAFSPGILKTAARILKDTHPDLSDPLEAMC
ncbi:MAG: hypothetical protein AB7E59_08815 [Pusillimonas sp.]